ncbi:MAG: hypothetical protein ABUJ92_00660 [Desulfobacterales bacterium]
MSLERMDLELQWWRPFTALSRLKSHVDYLYQMADIMEETNEVQEGHIATLIKYKEILEARDKEERE